MAAEPELSRALAILEPIRDPRVGMVLSTMASCSYMEGKREASRRAAERAIAQFEEAQGKNAPDLCLPLSILGWVLVDERRFSEARPHLERALGLAGNPHRRALVQFPLAKALWAQGEKSRAIELAKEARAAFEAVDPEGAKEVAGWLRRHGG